MAPTEDIVARVNDAILASTSDGASLGAVIDRATAACGNDGYPDYADGQSQFAEYVRGKYSCIVNQRIGRRAAQHINHARKRHDANELYDECKRVRTQYEDEKRRTADVNIKYEAEKRRSMEENTKRAELTTKYIRLKQCCDDQHARLGGAIESNNALIHAR